MRRSASTLISRFDETGRRPEGDFWKQYVQGVHERNPFAGTAIMRRVRTDPNLGMPTLKTSVLFPAIDIPGASSFDPSASPKPKLPAIRSLDKYSKLALMKADAEKQSRMTPPPFPKHDRPAVLASELYAQALERKERARLRREARQAAAAAADAAAAAEAARAGGALNAAAMAEKAAKKKKMEALKKSSMVMQAQDAINNKFKDMFKAFQYIDLDHSGTLNEKELAQALDMFNVPLDKKKLKEIIAACDADGDGSIDYKEFVDVLARDTVTIAAMGKRDMQALEAMGVESLSKEFLKNEGNRFYKNDKATINKDYETMMAASANAPVQTEAQKKAALNQARDAINAKFSNMRKAFQDLDLDASGTLSPKELYHAFDRFNLQMDRGRFQSIIDACDKDGNGSISYEEFVDVLARDTVADAAMGKRGLQAIDAMGVESLDKEFLGHKHIKNIKASINNLDDLF